MIVGEPKLNGADIFNKAYINWIVYLPQKFRRPDCLRNPSEKLKKMSKNRYQKVAGSRAIGKYLDLSNQRSPSFRNLIFGMLRALNS